MPLKSRLEVIKGHWKYHWKISFSRSYIPISLPWKYSSILYEIYDVEEKLDVEI